MLEFRLKAYRLYLKKPMPNWGTDLTDLENVLSRFESIGVPLRHVIGNHCLDVSRDDLEQRLAIEPFYTFDAGDWRVIVLDTFQVSVLGVPADHPGAVAAEAWLAAHPQGQFLNATRWNGAVGQAQRSWLAAELAAAEEAGERALVLGHGPLLPAASTDHHVAWDHAEVRAVLEASPATFAYFCGHDHAGGYATSGGVHHLTVHGMLEAPPGSNAYAIVTLHPDRIEVDGFGEEPDRVLARLR